MRELGVGGAEDAPQPARIDAPAREPQALTGTTGPFMMRQFFLFLSTQKGMRKWMETSPVSKKFTQRFVAGETLDDALAVCDAAAGRRASGRRSIIWAKT